MVGPLLNRSEIPLDYLRASLEKASAVNSINILKLSILNIYFKMGIIIDKCCGREEFTIDSHFSVGNPNMFRPRGTSVTPKRQLYLASMFNSEEE